jgi:hypothetical protein
MKLTKEAVMVLFNDDVEERKKRIHEFITDKSNSYEDRLEVFHKTPGHLYTTSPWIIKIEGFRAVTWMEKFYVDRHQTVDVSAIVGELLTGDYADAFPEGGADKFINDVLDLGVHSFKLDW